MSTPNKPQGEEGARARPRPRRQRKEKLRPVYARTDDGNASRFAADHRPKLRYAEGAGWFRWNGRLWEPVSEDAVLANARTTARRITDEADALSRQGKDADAMKRWARTSQSASKLMNMVRLAKGGEEDADYPDLRISASMLDHSRDVINTPEGVVDLRTGALLGARAAKAQYCTRITAAHYDPDADMEPWLRLLRRHLEDPKVVAAFQRILGAAATGHVPKVLPMLHGETDTGKTTATEICSRVLGSYAATALEGTFTNSGSREAQYDLAKLRGARLVTFGETIEGRTLASERIKRWTGGELISARSPYGKPFEFHPQFLIVITTNHAPVIGAGDSAMWNRLWAFPFTGKVPGRQNINFPAEFASEHGAGVLRWLIEGAGLLYASRMNPGEQPPAMLLKRSEWHAENDVIGRWVADRTEPSEHGSEPFNMAFADWKDWCEEHGEAEAVKHYTARKFHGALDAHYTRSEKKSKGHHRWLGMRLLPHPTNDEEPRR